MQSIDYKEIYKLFSEDNEESSKNKEELTMLKYFLHNMITISKENNTYILVPYNNKDEKYLLTVNPNKIEMNCLEKESLSYKDFSVTKEYSSLTTTKYTHLLERNGNFLHISGEYSYNTNGKNELEVDIKGYDKNSLEIIDDYYNNHNNKVSILRKFDNVETRIGIVPDLERELLVDSSMYIRLADILEKNIIYYFREHAGIEHRNSIRFILAMSYIYREDFLTLLENDTPFIINNSNTL